MLMRPICFSTMKTGMTMRMNGKTWLMRIQPIVAFRTALR